MSEPDELSAKPGRTRIVFPIPTCAGERETARKWIAGARQAYGDRIADAYGYLLNRCDLVAEIQRSGRDPVEWLADEGYDSPAAECRVPVEIDRRIRPGDAIAVLLWEDGTLRLVNRVTNWDPVPGWLLGRVMAQTPNAWLLSSGGREVLVRIDGERSLTLDHEAWDSISIPIFGERFELPVERGQAEIRGDVWIPCVRGWFKLANESWQWAKSSAPMPLAEIPDAR